MELAKTIDSPTLSKLFKSSDLMSSSLRCILHSKRLLSDHVDILEQCGVTPPHCDYVPNGKKYNSIIIHGLVASSLTITSLHVNTKCFRYLFATLAASYSFYVTIKTFSLIRRKIFERRIEDTIEKIKNADSAIRKNISFFRESQFLANDAISLERHTKRGQLCVKSISEIITTVYDDVRLLESFSLPEYFEMMYEPLEELTNCTLFQNEKDDFSSDHIKALYNIFLYFQSQYLLRLYLIIRIDETKALKYLGNENVVLRNRLNNLAIEMSSWLNVSIQKLSSKQMSNESRFVDSKDTTSQSVDLSKMKNLSMDIFCRFVAITSQFKITDQRIQATEMKSQFRSDATLVDLQQMQDAIVSCQHDLEMLKLITNKYSGQDSKLIDPVGNIEEPNEDVDAPNQECTSEERKIEDECKEYFAIRDANEWNDNNSDISDVSNCSNWTDESDDIDKKVTRLTFAPVLKQLKSKIDPIKTEMKERELKFLISKGIRREKIEEFDVNEDKQEISNADEENPRRPVFDRYDENRTFLNQKQPVAFLPLAHFPLPSSASEDILE